MWSTLMVITMVVQDLLIVLQASMPLAHCRDMDKIVLLTMNFHLPLKKMKKG